MRAAFILFRSFSMALFPCESSFQYHRCVGSRWELWQKISRYETSPPSSAQDSSLSQDPVVLASIASTNLALTTFKDVLGEMLVTFFAVIGTLNISPVQMDAIVLLSQHFSRCFDALDPIVDALGLRNSVNDDICTCKQVLLIPLSTSANLPFGTADIAELGSASASVRSQPEVQKQKGELPYVMWLQPTSNCTILLQL